MTSILTDQRHPMVLLEERRRFSSKSKGRREADSGPFGQSLLVESSVSSGEENVSPSGKAFLTSSSNSLLLSNHKRQQQQQQRQPEESIMNLESPGLNNTEGLAATPSTSGAISPRPNRKASLKAAFSPQRLAQKFGFSPEQKSKGRVNKSNINNNMLKTPIGDDDEVGVGPVAASDNDNSNHHRQRRRSSLSDLNCPILWQSSPISNKQRQKRTVGAQLDNGAGSQEGSHSGRRRSSMGLPSVPCLDMSEDDVVMEKKNGRRSSSKKSSSKKKPRGRSLSKRNNKSKKQSAEADEDPSSSSTHYHGSVRKSTYSLVDECDPTEDPTESSHVSLGIQHLRRISQDSVTSYDIMMGDFEGESSRFLTIEEVPSAELNTKPKKSSDRRRSSLKNQTPAVDSDFEPGSSRQRRSSLDNAKSGSSRERRSSLDNNKMDPSVHKSGSSSLRGHRRSSLGAPYAGSSSLRSHRRSSLGSPYSTGPSSNRSPRRSSLGTYDPHDENGNKDDSFSSHRGTYQVPQARDNNSSSTSIPETYKSLRRRSLGNRYDDANPSSAQDNGSPSNRDRHRRSSLGAVVPEEEDQQQDVRVKSRSARRSSLDNSSISSHYQRGRGFGKSSRRSSGNGSTSTSKQNRRNSGSTFQGPYVVPEHSETSFSEQQLDYESREVGNDIQVSPTRRPQRSISDLLRQYDDVLGE